MGEKIAIAAVMESIQKTGVKIRVFRKSDKKMMIVDSINFSNRDSHGEAWLIKTSDDLDVMLYCGKDKNGKNLFAGDIVLKHDGKTRAVLFYNHDMYRFELTPAWYGEAEDAWHPSHVERIGNIYQNKELLEQEASDTTS